MKRWVLALYSGAHFWVDFSCALLMFGRGEGVTAFLAYNFCAFALQLPLGLLADKLGGARWFAAGGCVLTAVAWGVGGGVAPLVAGVGNACFHVGGGVYTLNTWEGCGPLGVFVSPGALGVYLGAVLATPGPLVWLTPLLLAPALLFWGRGREGVSFHPAPVGAGAGVLGLFCLFSVVVVRSALAGAFTFPWRGELGLTMALAVVLGKAAGGLLADRFGRVRVACASLGLAAVGFLLAQWPVPGLLSIFAFQMTMPLTLRGAADRLRGAKGMAFGLLTLALFLGALPGLLGAGTPGGGLVCALGAALSLPLLLWGLKGGSGS